MLLLKGRCKEADPRFHWGINCLWFTAEKQHAQEVADMPDRHVFWLFHNADAKDLLPFHSTKHPCATQSFAFWMGGGGGGCGSGILWWMMVCILLLNSGRLVYVPKGFHCNQELQLNLPCLWIQAIKKKGVHLYIRWILWNSLLQDVSDARNAQRDWIYLWVSHTFMVATACAKSEYKNWGEYPLMLQSLSPTLNWNGVKNRCPGCFCLRGLIYIIITLPLLWIWISWCP